MDEKKMVELTDDQLDQVAGGLIEVYDASTLQQL